MITTNLTCPRGAAKRINLSVVDDDGLAVNITGWTIVFELLDAWENYRLVSSAATTISAADGTCYGVFATTDTRLTPGLYRWTASRTDSGYEDVLASGNFQILGPKLAGISV